MTKNKKIVYGGVLLLGALVLLLDRAFTPGITTPATAVAQSPSRLADLVAAAAFGPIVSVQAAPFPKPQENPGSVVSDHSRDIFLLSPAARRILLGVDQDAEVGASRRHGGRRATTAEIFKQNHRITAVMTGSEAAFAIVDEQWLRVGDVLDSCKLTQIAGTSAKFRCLGGDAVLSVVQELIPVSSREK